MEASSSKRGPLASLGYPMFLVSVVAIAIIGNAGYALYPRFALPSASGTGVLVLATAAGIASFFSPCSFSMVATLLARENAVGRGRALGSAAALALGATLFLALTGAVIALGGHALFAGVTFTSDTGRVIRTVVGLGLIMLSLVQLGVVTVPFNVVADRVMPLVRIQSRLRRRHPGVSYTVYGFAYVLAGFG